MLDPALAVTLTVSIIFLTAGAIICVALGIAELQIAKLDEENQESPDDRERAIYRRLFGENTSNDPANATSKGD